jgi:hypothetical protein
MITRHEKRFSHVGKKLEEIMLKSKPLNLKYIIIFKFKRNSVKLINGWKVEIEENWERKNWEDPFSNNTKVV